MKKKRIAVLHSQTPFVRGGAEIHVENLTKQLVARGYEAELVMLPFRDNPEMVFYEHAFAWRMLDLSHCVQGAIDLVIATKFPTYGIQSRDKICWLIHQYRQAYDLYDHSFGLSSVPNGQRIRENVRRFDNQMLPECKLLYCNSKTVSKRLAKYNGIVKPHLYHPPGLQGRYQSGAYGDYVFSVGRVEALKRNDLLIRALPHCDRRVRAKIAGRGTQVEPLRALAAKLGVSDRVDFLGFVSDEDLIGLYANALCVFFAPVDEDYGYITLEGFLSQRPVITARDSGGVLEFVQDGQNGFVCAPAGRALGAAVQKLYVNRGMCAEFGRRGYEAVRGISWDVVVDALTAPLREPL